jgi:hypothetical protein
VAPAEAVAPAAATEDHLLLFNRSAFHALNLREGQSVRRIDHERDGRLVGSLVGVLTGDVFHSGHSASFGGPDFVRDAETATNVMDALGEAVATLEREGVRSIRVSARPTHYSGSEAAVQHALLNLGFAVERCELTLHIDLEPFPDAAAYVEALRSPARRALRHAMSEPFALALADDEDGWALGYRLLAANRAAKGRSLALSYDYVRAAREAFPGRVRMFLLEHDGRACAAALLYRVLPGRELVVYWGDASHGLPRSPMNLLAYRLVERLLAERVRSLDLGVSSLGGVPDQGLIQFKRSVLARESLRLDLVRGA